MKSDTAETDDGDTRRIDPEAFKLLAADGDANDQFGHSVSVDDDTALVGAYSTIIGRIYDVNVLNEAAYVFTRSGDAGTQQAKLLAADGDARDYFGYSISVDGDTALVGAPNEDEQGTNTGAVYAFDVSSVSDTGRLDEVGVTAESDGKSADTLVGPS